MQRAAIRAFAAALLFAGLARATEPPTNEDCLACHGDSTLVRESGRKRVSLYVSPEKFGQSLHGSLFRCVDCHNDIKNAMHEAAPAKVSCAQCHADQQRAYEHSLHARSHRPGDGTGATCVDCHGGPHELLPASDPKSKVHHANIPSTCGSCHGQKFVMEPRGLTTQPFLSYQESVHGRALQMGLTKSAVCTDCHGAHEIVSASDPKSPIFKFNVPETCGKCHAAVKQQFAASIHGQAVARGEWQAPVCTDCHGIHGIRSRRDPNSPVSAANLAEATCARCHESVRLSQEFGMEGRRATTYLASYHGLAARLGSPVVANCASCHGVHNILPSSDPRSTINHANLISTCGQCHPGVTEKFVTARVHVDASFAQDKGSLAVRWVRWIYVPLIVLVIGGMFIHNFVEWRWMALRRLRGEGAQIVRMTLNQRWQHGVLILSFTVLVVTGFALKYPQSGFAALLGMSERVRGIIHRIAGAALVGAGLYHLLYIGVWREGRSFLSGMKLSWADCSVMAGTFRYYLGRIGKKPASGRFNYAEKAEYWALLWGGILMGGTGVMLWAKVFFGNLLPRWWLDIATAIHFYEAVLATLAIVVWHFYHVFFSPHSYPMNWAWWTGKMPLERYREEHGADPEINEAP